MSINIQQNIPLAPLTTFKIGGPAKYFVEVGSEEELMEALQFANENNLKIFVLGGGSNILVSDEGFDGLVVKLKASNIPVGAIHELSLRCWAGENLASVVSLAKDNSLSGLEWAAGIPGTVGGAVRGNAGSPLGCIGDSVESVRVAEMSNVKIQMPNKIPNPNLKTFSNAECYFSYRDSIFKQNPNLIILSCVLKLKKGDRDEIELLIKEVIDKRNGGNFPNPKKPSPGSFFKNPVVKDKALIEKFEKETGMKVENNRTLYQEGEIKLPAGWLIDEVGLRGKKIGGAMVSEEHANFVVNNGGATAQDVIMLSSFIKRAVRDEFGVQLMEEIQYVGF